MTGPRQKSEGIAQFPNMLKIARELGCQIQPGAENPNLLTGLCPFHQSRTLHEAKTLHVDLQTTRFWCSRCDSAGNPLAFIAKVWGLSAQETYQFLQEGGPITARRPRRSPPEKGDGSGPPAAQNTALLTMATEYFSQQVETGYVPLSYLARLGVAPGPPGRLRLLFRGGAAGIPGGTGRFPGGTGRIAPVPGNHRAGVVQRLPGAVGPGLHRRHPVAAGPAPGGAGGTGPLEAGTPPDPGAAGPAKPTVQSPAGQPAGRGTDPDRRPPALPGPGRRRRAGRDAHPIPAQRQRQPGGRRRTDGRPPDPAGSETGHPGPARPGTGRPAPAGPGPERRRPRGGRTFPKGTVAAAASPGTGPGAVPGPGGAPGQRPGGARKRNPAAGSRGD